MRTGRTSTRGTIRTMTRGAGRALAAALASVALLACGDDPAAPEVDWDAWPHGRVGVPAGVTLAAEFTRTAQVGTASAIATNGGTGPVTLTYNDCAFGVRIYRAGAAAGDDPLYHDLPSVVPTSCVTITRQQSILPGESVTIPHRGLNLDPLRSRIGAGTFDVVTTYRTEVDGVVHEIPAGTLTL